MTRLLFTGGGGAATEALDRLLRSRYDVHFADADPCAKLPSIAADHWHVIPRGDQPAILAVLMGLMRHLGADLLVPGVDEELLRIAMARDGLLNDVDCDILLPDAEFVAEHLDKLRSMRLLDRLGIGVPLTERLAFRNRVTFPCIVKPRFGRGSRHVAVVASEAELDAHVRLSKESRAGFLVQTLLMGQEYTVTMVADKAQRLQAIVPVKVTLKKGVTLRGQTDHDQAVMELCRSIHAAQPFSGCVNVQCIKAEDGTAQPFEINPRISTTACVAIAAGVDVIGLYWSRTVPSKLAPFRDLTMKRSWQTEFA